MNWFVWQEEELQFWDFERLVLQTVFLQQPDSALRYHFYQSPTKVINEDVDMMKN